MRHEGADMAQGRACRSAGLLSMQQGEQSLGNTSTERAQPRWDHGQLNRNVPTFPPPPVPGRWPHKPHSPDVGSHSSVPTPVCTNSRTSHTCAHLVRQLEQRLQLRPNARRPKQHVRECWQVHTRDHRPPFPHAVIPLVKDGYGHAGGRTARCGRCGRCGGVGRAHFRASGGAGSGGG